MESITKKIIRKGDTKRRESPTKIDDFSQQIKEFQFKIEKLNAENLALRISEANSHQTTKESFSQAANAIEALRIARETIKDLADEVKKRKNFESYSYYVGSEITCGRIPLKYSSWLDKGCPA